jgi:hypothetical protein
MLHLDPKLGEHLYTSHAAWTKSVCCRQYAGGHTGNVDGSEDGRVNLADITALTDHVYISHAATAPCP